MLAVTQKRHHISHYIMWKTILTSFWRCLLLNEESAAIAAFDAVLAIKAVKDEWVAEGAMPAITRNLIDIFIDSDCFRGLC